MEIEQFVTMTLYFGAACWFIYAVLVMLFE
jgi:hypothetical protein